MRRQRHGLAAPLHDARADFGDFHAMSRMVVRPLAAATVMAVAMAMTRPDDRNRQTQDDERQHVKRAGEREHDTVSEPTIEQRAHDLPEHDAAHRAAKADQAGDGADGVARIHVGGKDHDERRPRLLAEIREAEDRERPGDRRAGTNRTAGITAALRPSAILRARSSGISRVSSQLDSHPPDETADAGRGIRNPGERADRLDVEAARVVEIFRQPEQIEVPRRVAEELRDDEPHV